MWRLYDLRKGALCLFFFSCPGPGKGQEIFWKGKELQSGSYKTIEGEITILTPEDTIRATRAVLFNQPRKVVLQGNLSLVRKGARVTGDSGIYFPAERRAEILGNARIQTTEGSLLSERFSYDMSTRVLSSPVHTSGSAEGISFSAARSRFYPSTRNMWLQGNARWENDSIRGSSDTLFLDKEAGRLKMSRNATLTYKRKPDRISGSFLELDLKDNRIARVEGSEISRGDMKIKASRIEPRGEDYNLSGNVSVASTDSAIWSAGSSARIRKKGMDMDGQTITRIRDKEKNEVFLFAPAVRSARSDTMESYSFFRPSHIRGQFDGFCDSIQVFQSRSERKIFLYRNAHIQNDSLYLEGDTIEILRDSLFETIRAKRNALLIMLTRPYRVNTISGAFIELKKSEAESRMVARGSTESFLWNDEKPNEGINHTRAPEQRSVIRDRKISRVTTRGATESRFQPVEKADMSYVDVVAARLRDRYAADSVLQNLPPVRHFLRRKQDRPIHDPGPGRR